VRSKAAGHGDDQASTAQEADGASGRIVAFHEHDEKTAHWKPELDGMTAATHVYGSSSEPSLQRHLTEMSAI
jgi:hypothetical protein